MAANFKLYFFALWYNEFIYVYDVRFFLSKNSSYGQLILVMGIKLNYFFVYLANLNKFSSVIQQTCTL